MSLFLQRRRIKELEQLLERKQAALEATVAGMTAVGSKIYIVPDGAVEELGVALDAKASKRDVVSLENLLERKQTALDAMVTAMCSGSTMYMIPDSAVAEFRAAIELAASGRDL